MKRRARAHGSVFPRPWTAAERRVVWNGLCGRLLIAVEPFICTVVFAALTLGLIFFTPASAKLTRWEAAVIISPVFGISTLAFAAYAVALLAGPARALFETFSPILVCDGYVRYRGAGRHAQYNVNGYVAVLDHRRRTVAEWPSYGEVALPDHLRPALVEFTPYAGIHRIDGQATGVLPASIGAFGVGAARVLLH